MDTPREVLVVDVLCQILRRHGLAVREDHGKVAGRREAQRLITRLARLRHGGGLTPR